MSAKWLHADHRANNIAVHIHIACFYAAADFVDAVVDAAVDAVGEGVACAVDLFNQLGQFVAAVADNVEHGPEHFAFEFAQIVKFKQDGGNECAALGGFRLHFDFVIRLRHAFHFFNVGK